MQRGTVQSNVVEGIVQDTCLIVIEEQERSYVIVKGEHDNIVVELDDDGWANLAMLAAAQQSKVSLNKTVGRQNGRTMVAAAIEDEMMSRNLLPSEIAGYVGIDRAAMVEVLESRALWPVSMNERLVDALGFSRWSVEEMQRQDRGNFKDLRELSPSFVARSWRNRNPSRNR